MQSVTTLCRQAERTSGWETGEERLYETRTVRLGFKCWCTIHFPNKKKINIWRMIAFSLFLIINSHLSAAFTVMPAAWITFGRTHFYTIDDLCAAFWLLAENHYLKWAIRADRHIIKRGKYVFIVVVLYTFMLLKGKIFFLWQSVSQVQLI